MDFQEGETVWCRPRLIDKPKIGTYVREISLEERKKGFRAGHVVRINQHEQWVRGDLCGKTPEDIKDIKS